MQAVYMYVVYMGMVDKHVVLSMVPVVWVEPAGPPSVCGPDRLTYAG